MHGRPQGRARGPGRFGPPGARARARRVTGESFWTTRSFCERADAWIIGPRRHPRGLDGSRWFQNGVFETTETQPLAGESIKRCARDQVDALQGMSRTVSKTVRFWALRAARGAPQAAGESVFSAIFRAFFATSNKILKTAHNDAKVANFVACAVFFEHF